MKKKISLLLAVVMLVSLLPMPVYSDAGTRLVISDATANPGEEFSVTVSIQNNPGISGIAAELSYDNTVMELLSGEGMSKGNWLIDDLPKTGTITWFDLSDYTSDGVILTLNFKLKGTATPNKAGYPVSIWFDPDWDGIANSAEESIDCEIIPGTVRVTCAHTPAAAVQENFNDSTCAQEGSYDEVVYCSVCGDEISRTPKTVAKKAHDTELVNAAAADCEHDGYTGDYVCKNCHNTITAGSVITKLGHKYTIHHNDDTQHWDECERCHGLSEKTDHALTYTYKDEENHTVSCSDEDCSHTDTEAHSGGTATCTSKAVCSFCNHSYGSFAPHNYIEKAEEKYLKTAGTCTQKAVYYKSCSACGGKGTETFEGSVDSDAHTWGSWQTTKSATCKETGTKTRTCSACEKAETESIPVTSTHTLTHVAAKEATTESEGNTEYWYCSECGKYFSDSEGKTEITQVQTVIERLNTNPDEPVVIASGSFGENLAWEVNADCVLKISGTGDMPYYDMSTTRPWAALFTSIQTVVIADGVTGISNWAFYGCSQLTNVSISESVESIGTAAFLNCTNLTNVTIPGSVKSIGESTFSGCQKLSEVIISDGVVSIGNYAFSNCAITNITIPASVTSVYGSSFYDCDNLTDINVDSGNEVYSSYDGLLLNEDGTELIKCPRGKTGSVSIPSGVKTIKDSAFSCCVKITEVNIPVGVLTIEEHAFYACTSLTSASIPVGVSEIKYNVFGSCKSLTGLTIPASVTSIVLRNGDFFSFSGCEKLTEFNVSDKNMTYSSENGMLLNKDGTKLILSPPGKNTASISIPEGITSIGDGAFANYTRLTSAAIPEGVEYIESDAFCNCTSLSSVTIPKTMKGINRLAFDDCSALKDVYYSGTEEEWNEINVSDSKVLAATVHFNGVGAHTHNLTHVAAKDATTEAEGNIEYWKCSDCEKYFSDSEGKNEITLAQTVIPKVNPDAMQITVSGGQVIRNNEIQVKVSLSKNPGVASISADLVYDKTKLTLLSATSGIATGSWVELDDITESGNFMWYSTDNHSSDGVILTLTFKANADAALGDTNVSIVCDEDFGGIFNAAGSAVPYNVVAGTINISNRKPGDLNGDNKVNGADVILIAQYIKAKGVGINIVAGSADTNGDGRTNGADVILLAQYVKAKGVGIVIH